MKKFWNSLYLNNLFFYLLGAVAFIYLMSHFYERYYAVASITLLGVIFVMLIDMFLLFRSSSVHGKRTVNPILSNGDPSVVKLELTNTYPFPIKLKLFEEPPYQFPQRDLLFNTTLASMRKKKLDYEICPVERGEFEFGDMIVMVRSPLRMIKRRYQIPATQKVAVYPSFAYMSKYKINNFKRYSDDYGVHQIRKIGQSTEFEQIKGYIKGDDIRHINWKASAKKNQLMVNHYTDEKSQQVYCIIDTGRAMQMPFNGLSLLDYSINAALAVSHVIINNYDKAGVMYFNKKVENIVPANGSMSQLQKVMNLLYNVKTTYQESNFESLYAQLKYKVSHRSLLLLFSNFEDLNSMKRQLPYLKSISKNNVLVIIFFLNSELEDVITQEAKHSEQYFQKAVSEKMSYQKRLIARELNRHGIKTILTDPKDLNMRTIDMYLEIKDKALI